MDEKMLLLNEKIKDISNNPNIFENINILGIFLDDDFNQKIVNAFKDNMENTFLLKSNQRKK